MFRPRLIDSVMKMKCQKVELELPQKVIVEKAHTITWGADCYSFYQSLMEVLIVESEDDLSIFYTSFFRPREHVRST